MHTVHSQVGGAATLDKSLKIQIKVHHQILNEWGAYPILNLKQVLMLYHLKTRCYVNTVNKSKHC